MQTAPLLLPPFQGHLVRRPPTEGEVTSRGSCVLTQRDLDIIAATGLHGFLTASLVGLAFFTPLAGTQRRPTSRAFERLRLLWLWGYLDRYVLPAPRGTLGNVPFLYALGTSGLPYVGPSPTKNVMAPRYLEQLDPRFVQHELAAAAVWAHLQAQVQTGQLVACRWTPERVLRGQRQRVQDPATQQWLPVLFDGYAELEHEDGQVRCCMVEIDRGTLTVDRFHRKLRAWESYIGSGRFTADWGHADGSLVVFVESWGRLRELWKAGRRLIPESRWDRYLFATLNILAPDRFGAADGWLSLRSEYTSLLDGLRPAMGARAATPGNDEGLRDA